MSEVVTNVLGSGLGIIKLRWMTGNEQSGAEDALTILSGDVLRDTDLLAKEEKKMAKGKVETLMAILETRHGFVLGEELLNVTEKELEEFSERWIKEARQLGGVSREMIQDALAGKGRTETLSFAEEWKLLLWQASEPEYRIEMDEWNFELHVERAGRVFRLPYCSTAMSVCNKVIQHYNRD